jgi:hypothetical protein
MQLPAGSRNRACSSTRGRMTTPAMVLRRAAWKVAAANPATPDELHGGRVIPGLFAVRGPPLSAARLRHPNVNRQLHGLQATEAADRLRARRMVRFLSTKACSAAFGATRCGMGWLCRARSSVRSEGARCRKPGSQTGQSERCAAHTTFMCGETIGSCCSALTAPSRLA